MRVKKISTICIIFTMVLSVSGCGFAGKVGSAVVDKVGSTVQSVDRETQLKTSLFLHLPSFEYMKECVENGTIGVNEQIVDEEAGYMKVSPLFMAPQPPWPQTEYLLEQGANPNVAFGDTTLLMWSTGAHGVDDTSSGELYIKYGADVNLQDSDGHSALYYAVKFGRTDYVKLLLNNGAKVTQNVLDKVEISAMNMFQYSQDSHDENTSWWNADTTAFYTIPALVYEAAEKQGLTVNDSLLKAAVQGDSAAVIKDIQVGKSNDIIPYIVAAYCKPDVMRYLVSKGLNVAALPNDEPTLLWMAAAAGNLEMVQYLVQYGASVNYSDYEDAEGYSNCHPLISAIANNRYDVAKYLLENGFEIDMELERGPDEARVDATGSMMIAAVSSGNPEFIPLLLAHGYSINKDIGYHALDAAILDHQNEVLEALLKQGIDPNYSDSRYGLIPFTIIEECASSGTLDAMKILNQYELNIKDANTNALSNAAQYGQYDVLKYLLDEGMPVDAHYVANDGSTGYQAIFSAVGYGYFDKVKLLVERGADINNPDGASLFQTAATSKNILEYLIKAGADVNLQNSGDKKTALMQAARNDNVTNIQVLLDADADKTLKDRDGKTAYDYAKDANAAEAMALLK